VAATSPPPNPADFVARSIGDGGVLFLWSAVPTASSFSLEVFSNISPTFQPLITVGGATQYVSDGTTTANNVFTYRLAPINAAGTSGGVTASSISAPQPPEGPAHCHHAGVSYILSRRAAHVYTNQLVTWTVLDGMDGGSIIASGVTAPAGGAPSALRR